MDFKKYILKGHEVVECEDPVQWGRWFQDHSKERTVAQEEVGPWKVSTVFLGMDHQLYPEGFPLLFETIVFDANMHSVDCERYTTWDEAEDGHRRMVGKWRGVSDQETSHV